MYFEDVVKIKEADCCEKCSSFEYDLPCRIDINLVLAISRLVNGTADQINDVNKLFKSGSTLKIEKDENLKVELKLNNRYMKLCAPTGDMVFKAEVEDVLADWISDTLKIEIERI